MPKNRENARRRGNEARVNVHAEAAGGIARVSEDQLIDRLREERDPLLLILDGVQDPHNLGACLRSADGAGALAVVVPRHHTAPVTDTVVRVACGAAASVPVVSVGNLARFLELIRDELGIRVVGTADQAEASLFQAQLTGPLALVLGAEEKGLRRLTMEHCDQLISIPMSGKVPCLNVSNAAAVCLFEAVRQRSKSE